MWALLCAGCGADPPEISASTHALTGDGTIPRVKNPPSTGDLENLPGDLRGRPIPTPPNLDDFVRVVFAAEEKARNKSVYLVADDEPTTQLEYATWLCDHLGLPMPGKRALYEPGKPATNHRNRKFRNTRMKTELGIELLYPSFREGEKAIDAAEAAT